MESEDFDVIPVDDGGSINRYFMRQDDGPPSLETVKIADVVSADLPLLELFEHFANSDRRFYLTLGGRRIDGIATCADLNKVAVRVLIYAILNRLELLLKELVEAHCDDSRWMAFLSEPSRKNVQERLEEARRGSVELVPTAYLDLSDFLAICKQTPQAWLALGVESKNELNSRYGALVALRHDVAHPVRPLVTASEGVNQTWKRIDSARRAIATLEPSLHLP